MSAVSEIMSPKKIVAIRIGSDSTVLDAARLMNEKDTSSIVVTDKAGKPIGIITERDIIRKVALRNKLLKDVAVKEVMSSPLVTIKAYDSIETAATVMAKNKIKRLAVLEDNGSLAGVLSITDISNKLSEILDNEYKRYSTLKALIEAFDY